MSAPATPPVWKVRSVSCVPGSPIDWAAMMPTASPIATTLPVAGRRAVALLAEPLGLALEHRADRHGRTVLVAERLGDLVDVRPA